LIIEPSSILVINPWASIHKAPGPILPYDHFPGFFHNSFLRNMVVRVSGKYVPLIYIIIRIDTELIESFLDKINKTNYKLNKLLESLNEKN
jgi:hypothetical protein